MSATSSEFRVFDLHCDTVDALAMSWTDDFVNSAHRTGGGNSLVSNNLMLATERMGGMAWTQCYAIFVPDTEVGDAAHDFYRKAADWFHADVARNVDAIAQARTMDEVEAALESDRVAAILTVENGSPIGTDLARVNELAADGVQMVTLTWNGKNPIGSGNVTTDGLSSFGRQAVRALEEHRIVVDVSHLNDHGFADLLACSSRPFAASHSNSRAICNHPRNLTDDQFQAIVERGGVVGINYYQDFIVERDTSRPGTEATFDELCRHIDHFLGLGGARVLALGSDADGSTVPSWLDGCEKMPAFHAAMLGRYGEDLVDAMFFRNARDFFARNETL